MLQASGSSTPTPPAATQPPRTLLVPSPATPNPAGRARHRDRRRWLIDRRARPGRSSPSPNPPRPVIAPEDRTHSPPAASPSPRLHCPCSSLPDSLMHLCSRYEITSSLLASFHHIASGTTLLSDARPRVEMKPTRREGENKFRKLQVLELLGSSGCRLSFPDSNRAWHIGMWRGSVRSLCPKAVWQVSLSLQKVSAWPCPLVASLEQSIVLRFTLSKDKLDRGTCSAR